MPPLNHTVRENPAAMVVAGGAKGLTVGLSTNIVPHFVAYLQAV
jgi:hypothetical protein